MITNVKLEKIKNFLFHNTSLRQTVIKNTFWLSISAAASKIIRAVLIIYAARILGTEDYGILSYALGFAAFFSIFSDIGISNLLTRESAKGEEVLQKYFSTTFVIKLILLALTILVTIFIAPHLTTIVAAKPLIPLMALLLGFDSLRNFGFSVARGQNRMQLEAGLNVVTDILITGLGMLVLFTTPTTYALAITYAIGSGVGFIFVFIALYDQFRNSFKHFDKTLVKPILTTSWPFAISGLLAGFMINIDTIILGWFRTTHELGLYAAAQRPVLLLYSIPALFASGVFPIMSKLAHTKEYERLKSIIEKTITGTLALALPITLGGIIIGNKLIILLFGAEYANATLAFQLLLTTTIFVFFGSIASNAIFAYDKQKTFLVSSILGASANVILDLLLIPPYGIAGSAVATIISQFCAHGYNWRTMKRLNGFKTLPYLKKIGLSTLVMGIIVFLINRFNVNVIVTIAVAIGVYIGMLYVLREPLFQLLPFLKRAAPDTASHTNVNS